MSAVLIITTWMTGSGTHTHSITFDSVKKANEAANRHGASIKAIRGNHPGHVITVVDQEEAADEQASP